MCSTLNSIDIIYIRMNIFRERAIILKCNLNRDISLIESDMNRFLYDPFPVRVEIINKFLQSQLRSEFLIPGFIAIYHSQPFPSYL